jgi:hypothetical protein
LFFESGVVSNIFSAIKTKQPKLFLDTLRFPSMLLLIAVIQVSFTLIMIYLLKRDSFNKRLYGVLIGFNSILFCWLALPFNFISQLRTKEVNNYVSSFPDGYPLPDLSIPAGSGIFSDSSSIPVYGYPNFYSKQISIQDHVITPTLNSAYEEFNNNKKLRLLLKDYPFAWLNDTIVATVPDSTGKKFSYGCYSYKNRKDTSGGSLKLVAFNPNKFVFDVNSSQATVLTLLQQFNFNWRITVNNEKAQMLRMNQAFIGVSVPQGNSTVVFNYKPVRVIMAGWISFILLLIILAYLLFTASRIKRG